MGEFTKIELGSSEKRDMVNSSFSESKQRKFRMKFPKKTVAVLGVILGLLFILALFFVIFPAQQTYKAAQKTNLQARSAWAALKKQNIELASTELVKTKEELTNTQKSLQKMSYLQYIPIVSWYYNDADHMVKAGFHGLEAATIVVDSIKPYTDVLGLKGQGSFVMGSAEDRIRLAVLTMGKITPRIDDVSKSLVKAREEIDQVKPGHYPAFLVGTKINDQLVNVQKIADEGITLVDQSRPLIKVLPALLGESKEKKYLVLFQNDKELRPTGGFITAYAVFRVDKGSIHVDRSDDIYTLDNSIRSHPKAPDPILKYLPKVTTFNLRDSNLSPDYVESMKTFQTLYDKAANKVTVDGIIALDTHVLVSIIKILDDEVVAGGIKFTSQTDKRCDCPQVIYELEDNISRPVNYVKTARKDLLGTLLYAIMQKALKSSPKLYWGPLIQEMLTKTNEKHILFYLYDKDAQSGIEALNAAGRIKEFEGDYLHINEANLGGAKANLFVEEAVTQAFDIAGDGSITKTVTINYKNPHPPSNCDLEAGGLCLNAPFRDWIRIYVPKGSELVSSQGSEVKMTTSEDLGKTVIEGFLTVRPLGKATLTVKYKLPFKLASGSTLPLLIQKQPGTEKHPYDIKVNGRTVEKFELLTDKQLTIQK